jgi:biotin synthase
MMLHDEIIYWLREHNTHRLESLWDMANQVRQEQVGNEVHLRGLIEISNYCARNCSYCGINRDNTSLTRYRMTEKEIFDCIYQINTFGYGTAVIQSGEDYGITAEWMAHVISRIKTETALAVTLSLGERTPEELRYWKKAGADRYLLRFETSDEKLYSTIHPPLSKNESPRQRLDLLLFLRELGYEVGSGIMVGIPGQTYESLAQDIHLFQTLDLDMIGIGPYISSHHSALGKGFINPRVDAQKQVPASELMTYKVIALARLACPSTNIPSTTALATLNEKQGRELGLKRGANIVMPNVTPIQYRNRYEIYPGKACVTEDALTCHTCIKKRILSLGRKIGHGPGNRKKTLC